MTKEVPIYSRLRFNLGVKPTPSAPSLSLPVVGFPYLTSRRVPLTDWTTTRELTSLVVEVCSLVVPVGQDPS